jgi:hypothetical protein
MAHVCTPLPTVYGEWQLAKLASFPDERLHLWFSLNFIPNVRDIDLIIWHERAGVFVVEVKAVPLDMIETFGWNHCKIKDRDDKCPQLQANEAMYSLLNFIKPLTGRIFMTSVACFPQIRRSDWNRRWDDGRVTGPYADSMLFHDDMYSDPDALIERLEHIRLNPTIGEKKTRSFVPHPIQFDKFLAALDVSAKPKPSASDLDKLRTIESTVRKEQKKLIPPFSGLRVLYTGPPGTGKTFRLLKVAHQHALQGCKVLFACFNKVLAADIKRLLKFSEKLLLTNGEIEIHDVWEIINLRGGKPPGGEIDMDEWASCVVDEMKKEQQTLPKFDTILIDEAQDLKGWAFEMLFVHAHDRSTICIAGGNGQELYGPSSESLKNFGAKAKKRVLRRNFRNTETMGRFALTCYDANWDASRIHSVLSRFASKSSEDVFDFYRPGGELPKLVGIDESSSEADDMYPEEQNELMVKEYGRIIRSELENLGASHRPTDVLILVPSYSSNQRKWAAEALAAQGIAYLDYTRDENRRCIAPADQVRLSTFHSARGIEGERVIVLGVEQILDVARKEKAEPRNLGYIVLSRSVLDMVIIYRSCAITKEMHFLTEVLRAMRPKVSAVSHSSGTT